MVEFELQLEYLADHLKLNSLMFGYKQGCGEQEGYGIYSNVLA